MLDILKFVQKAVGRRDFVPCLTHFHIRNRTIRAFNGSLGLCAPIDIDLDFSPKAEDFIKAVSACTKTIAFHLTENGRLAIRSGKFKTFVDCDDSGKFPDINPTGRFIPLTAELMPALRYLSSFISEDASRQWSCGVLFEGGSAFATNNIVLVQYWLGYEFPTRINIPGEAVKQLLEIGQDPIHLQIEDRRLIFHYEDGKWLSTQLYEAAWPDVNVPLGKVCEHPQEAFPDGFWEALDQLLPFVDDLGRCYLLGDRLATSAQPELAGASVELPGCPAAGIFNARQLVALKGIADTIAFAAWPAPVPFFGKASRGVIVGIRQ